MKERRGSEDSFDALDGGLRAGFGGRAGSVISCLEDRTGSVLRLTLPEADDERDPVVKPVGQQQAASLGTRYQVLGEIARGGLGVVMKSRDIDLGRDVAVKVLHERFKNDRSVIERFVEEAQIGGQLQHPGIVPVYELGLRADDRPFFAMKLVKGETLAAMLKRRRDPSDDQQRFLRVFLQVCQTVAYAHVRRVVHRDLKPSNVLVGAFGEVQVVDWGLAKVLRAGGVVDEAARSREVSVIETIRSSEGSTHSIAGSVMGTPAYMPPEQARGEVELMDSRSDVFALGAILCEILSGKPPYDAQDPAENVQAAAECRQQAALERLETSGADDDLVELTRACLAPSRDARPLDAGEIATRVEAHLQSVEDRARRAEIRAAELRVRTRSYLALAGVVIAVLVLSGWAYFTWDSQQRARWTETARRANAAVDEATRYVGQAEQAGLGGVALWRSALSAARRAEEIVAAGDADAELESRVANLVQDVTRREQLTRAEALKEDSHELLLERLVEVRIGPDVPRLDFSKGRSVGNAVRFAVRRSTDRSSRASDSAARPRSRKPPSCSTARIANASRARWMPGPRRAAWRRSPTRPQIRSPGVGSFARPGGSTRDDPWRNALRDELAREELDVEALRGLARRETLTSRSAEEIAVVVALLDAAGDMKAAIETQLEGIILHPSDFWLSVSLANLCSQEELTSRIYHERASWATRGAFALRPESRAARFDLAMGYFVEDLAYADALLEEIQRENPGNQIVQAMKFMGLMESGRFEEAAAELPEVLPALQSDQLDWDYFQFMLSRGYGERLLETPDMSPTMQGLLLFSLGRFEEAWAIIEPNRENLRRRWPFLFLPDVLKDAGSAEDLRATDGRLRALATAGDAELQAAPAIELLAAADLLAQGWDDLATVARLFRQAFENDPESKMLWAGTRARQIAAFWTALASGGVTPGTADLPAAECSALRRQALAWMHEELDEIEHDLRQPDLTRETATRYSRVFHQMTIYGWLAPIREARYLARMSPEDAHACKVLWARIKGLEVMLVSLSAG